MYSRPMLKTSLYDIQCVYHTNNNNINNKSQGCGSKCIEFGSGSWILDQFGSEFGSRVMLSILKEKLRSNIKEKKFSLKNIF